MCVSVCKRDDFLGVSVGQNFHRYKGEQVIQDLLQLVFLPLHFAKKMLLIIFSPFDSIDIDCGCPASFQTVDT